jgi:hypothetical protein
LTIPEGTTEVKFMAFYNYARLTSVTFPTTLTRLGDGAFAGCTALTKITLPNSLKILGDGYSETPYNPGLGMIGNPFTPENYGVFYGCTGITTVTIPANVSEIRGCVFAGCSNLKTVYSKSKMPPVIKKPFPDTVEKIYVPECVYSLYTSTWSNYAGVIVASKDLGTSVSTGDSCKIYYKTSDNKIITPNFATWSNTYEDGQGLIVCPRSVTVITSEAFEGQTRLTAVGLPSSVTSIEKDAFRGCTSLTRVNIPNNVTSIGSYAFCDCEALTSVTIPEKVTSIGAYAFEGCSSLTNVTIPNSVTSIGGSVFENCTALKSVTIGSGVTAIESGAFEGCTSLTSITIPNSVTSIGHSAFEDCTSLTSVTIPNSVTSIVDDAFYRCTSLTSVTIPEKVTSIGTNAFDYCTSLKSVYCKPTTPPHDSEASNGSAVGSLAGWSGFNNNASGRKIYVPKASVNTYKKASGWKTYADDIVGYNF